MKRFSNNKKNNKPEVRRRARDDARKYHDRMHDADEPRAMMDKPSSVLFLLS